jgi:DNA-binding transcriptional LysR family regulator
MELRHVRAFLILAEELHFGRTAARLHLVQSAVSQTIKALEDEVGAPLFARTKRQVSLTPAGRELLAPARRMLDELDRGLTAARRAASGETGRLSLYFTMMAALTPLPRALARFQREHPDVEVTIAPGGSTEQLDALGLGRADIGFMAIKKDVAPFVCEVVEKDTLVAVVPSRHALAKRRSAAMRELVREPQIMLGEASEPKIRAALRRRFAEFGVEANVVLEVEQIETLLAFVAAGLGVALVPGFVRKLRFAGTAIVPVRPVIPCGISAVWNPDTLPPAGRRFLAVLRETAGAVRSKA